MKIYPWQRACITALKVLKQWLHVKHKTIVLISCIVYNYGFGTLSLLGCKLCVFSRRNDYLFCMVDRQTLMACPEPQNNRFTHSKFKVFQSET